MPEDYTNMVAELKTLTQGEGQSAVQLPMAEDGWNSRPETVSYGEVQLDFEVDALRGDNIKVNTAYEGSLDLYSLQKDGAGWVPLIKAVLTKYCDGAWYLSHHAYERETALFHWEWVFQVEE